MTFTFQSLTAESWLRRLDQEVHIGDDASAVLGDILNLTVIKLCAHMWPCQIYHRQILTFRGRYTVKLERTCVVSLEQFEETLTGNFERSFTLSPKAPSVPPGAEEAEEFPFEGIALITMLGDEIALSATTFPRKPGAQLPSHKQDDEATLQADRLNPFSVLAALK